MTKVLDLMECTPEHMKTYSKVRYDGEIRQKKMTETMHACRDTECKGPLSDMSQQFNMCVGWLENVYSFGCQTWSSNVMYCMPVHPDELD